MQANALCIEVPEPWEPWKSLLPSHTAQHLQGRNWDGPSVAHQGKQLFATGVRRTWCPETSLGLVAVLAAELAGQALCGVLQQRVVLPVYGNRDCFKMMALFSLLTSSWHRVVKHLWQMYIGIFTALLKRFFFCEGDTQPISSLTLYHSADL